MNLLESALIRKYFSCEKAHMNGECLFCNDGSIIADRHMAECILTAMQEPIKDGELFLIICNDGSIVEHKQRDIHDGMHNAIHTNYLRLPSRFQPPAPKECGCKPYPECSCDMNCADCHRQKPVAEAPKCHPMHNSCASCRKCLPCGYCSCIRANVPIPTPPSETCYRKECEGTAHYGAVPHSSAPDAVEAIVDEVMESVYMLSLGTTLKDAKNFLKSKFKEALARGQKS